MRIRVGDFIGTFSGVNFFPLDPLPEDIDIKDLSHSLSQKCRWNGMCEPFFSVAEHSLRVADVAEAIARAFDEYVPEIRLHSGLHDGNEAYMPDVPSPLKQYMRVAMPGGALREWKHVERDIDEAIFMKFNLVPTALTAKYTKLADSIMLAIEAEELFAPEKRKAWMIDYELATPLARAAANKIYEAVPRSVVGVERIKPIKALFERTVHDDESKVSAQAGRSHGA